VDLPRSLAEPRPGVLPPGPIRGALEVGSPGGPIGEVVRSHRVRNTAIGYGGLGLVVSAALILYSQNRILKAGRFQVIAGKSVRPMLLKLRGLKYPLLILSVIYIGVTVLLPTVTIFLVALLRTYGLSFSPENMTLHNITYILFTMKLTKDAIWNSFYLSLAAALVTMLVGTLISYVIVKMRVRGKFLLEFLGLLPFSVPGTVIALGVILMWSGQFGVNLYNTAWIIFVAYIARYMAFALKSTSAALDQVGDSLDEAARACGASHCSFR
jgi:iron(III) transport system permease protein